VSGQILTVFRSRLRDDRAPGYEETAAEMERRARDMPGFVDFKTFTASDGERVSIIVFASREAHEAWRDDPAHRSAQERGRSEWYASYSIQVSQVLTERRVDRNV